MVDTVWPVKAGMITSLSTPETTRLPVAALGRKPAKMVWPRASDCGAGTTAYGSLAESRTERPSLARLLYRSTARKVTL